jgi:hypothetical protein
VADSSDVVLTVLNASKVYTHIKSHYVKMVLLACA